MSTDERIAGQAHDLKDLELSLSEKPTESMCLAVSTPGSLQMPAMGDGENKPRLNAGQRGSERKRPIDLWELFCLPDCSRLSPSIVHDRPGVRALRRLGYWIDQ